MGNCLCPTTPPIVYQNVNQSDKALSAISVTHNRTPTLEEQRESQTDLIYLQSLQGIRTSVMYDGIYVIAYYPLAKHDIEIIKAARPVKMPSYKIVVGITSSQQIPGREVVLITMYPLDGMWNSPGNIIRNNPKKLRHYGNNQFPIIGPILPGNIAQLALEFAGSHYATYRPNDSLTSFSRWQDGRQFTSLGRYLEGK